MPLERRNWSVILPGRWNPGILTPAGIGKYVFGVEEEQELEVGVPLDGMAPYQVKHPRAALMAMGDFERLSIMLTQMDYQTLESAMACGVAALQKLPETPVLAAGFNVRFRADDHVDVLDELVASGHDDALSDGGYEIASRKAGRSLVFGKGRLNIALSSGEDGSRVEFNFHRGSKRHEDLITWLQTPVAEVQEAVESLLACLGLGEEVALDAD